MTVQPTRAPVPSVLRLGAVVVLQGAALAEVQHLVLLGVKTRAQRDGVPASPALVGLLTMIAAAVNESMATGQDQPAPPCACSRHGDVANRADSSSLELHSTAINTAEAARLLEMSTRQVQRIRQSIGFRRVGRRLQFDRSAVLAYAALRAENERDNR